MRWRRAALGLAVAVSIVALLVYGVGWEAVLSKVRRADPAALAMAVVAGGGILALRGLILQRLLVPIDGAARGVGLLSAFLAGYFARSALPWGRSTGAPITAYLLAANSDAEFEENLAVVAAAEAFAFLASLVVALVGLAHYAAIDEAGVDLPSGATLAGGVGLLAAAVIVVVLSRDLLRPTLLGLASRCESAVGRVPGIRAGEDFLRRRVEGFLSALETLGAARRTLAAAFAVALASWTVNALPLYFSLLALGVDVPIALALACAPLASFGGVFPVPGGTGGIEAVLIGLLVAMAGVGVDVATAAAVLYRLSTYWLHLVLGGTGAVYLSIVGTRPVEP